MDSPRLPHPSGLHRPRGRQPAGSAASGKPHEESFRHIVLLMAQPQGPDAARNHRPLEKVKPRRAGRRLADCDPGSRADPASPFPASALNSTPRERQTAAQNRASPLDAAPLRRWLK